jgi:hypothetical protein
MVASVIIIAVVMQLLKQRGAGKFRLGFTFLRVLDSILHLAPTTPPRALQLPHYVEWRPVLMAFDTANAS